MAEVTVESGKRRVARSPSYPSFAVDKALEYAERLHSQEGEYDAPLVSAMGAWGYSPKSSAARQALATLKYYGLIEVSGEGDARKVRVSEIGRRIILDEREDQSEKRELIRRVALTPNAHKLLFESYPNGIKSEATVAHELHFEHGFTRDAARDLIAEFQHTADFASIYEPETARGGGEANEAGEAVSGEDSEVPSVKVGYKVQRRRNGVYVFPKPATVLGVSEDGNWVFTDIGETAVPLREIVVLSASDQPPEVEAPPPFPAHLLAAQQHSLGKPADQSDGEAVVGRTVLSRGKLRNGHFEVVVSGEIGAKEISKIIKLLEAQRDILADDEEAFG